MTTAKKYPRRIIPLCWSFKWRQWRRRLLTKRAPSEPGMRHHWEEQIELVRAFLRGRGG